MNILLTVFLVGFILLILERKKNLNPKIPGPYGLPIVGSLLSMRKDVHLVFQKWYNQYGNVYAVRMGDVDSVVITGFPTLKKAFVDNSKAFEKRQQRKSNILANNCQNLQGANGELHSKLKKIVLTEMTQTRIKKAELNVINECEKLCAVLDKHVEEGKPFQMNAYARQFSLNVILRFVFGVDYEYNSKEAQSIAKIIGKINGHAGETVLFDYVPLLQPLTKSQYVEAYPKISEHVKNMIEEYKEKKSTQPSNENAYVPILEKLLNECDNGNISYDNVISTCVDTFLAGSDSAGNSLAFGLIAMANHCDVQEKLHGEIQHSVKQNGDENSIAVSHSKYRSLIPYLSMSIKETYRLYPALPFGIPHVTSEDVEIEGHKIAKGTQIFQNIYSSHRCDKLFQYPNEFIPERFIESGCNGMTGGSLTQLVDFGVGVRDCLGKSLADCEIFMFFATLLNRYEFINPNPSIPLIDFSSNYQPHQNNFIIKKRVNAC